MSRSILFVPRQQPAIKSTLYCSYPGQAGTNRITMGLSTSKEAPLTVPTVYNYTTLPVSSPWLHSEIRGRLGRGAAASRIAAITRTRGVEEIRSKVAVEEYMFNADHFKPFHNAPRRTENWNTTSRNGMMRNAQGSHTVVEHEMNIESHHEAYALPTRGTKPSVCTYIIEAIRHALGR